MGGAKLSLGGEEATPHYSNLLVAVQYYPGRWLDATVAAAAEVEGRENLDPQEWTALLDEIDEALRSVFPEEEPVSRMRIRTGAKFLRN